MINYDKSFITMPILKTAKIEDQPDGLQEELWREVDKALSYFKGRMITRTTKTEMVYAVSQVVHEINARFNVLIRLEDVMNCVFIETDKRTRTWMYS